MHQKQKTVGCSSPSRRFSWHWLLHQKCKDKNRVRSHIAAVQYCSSCHVSSPLLICYLRPQRTFLGNHSSALTQTIWGRETEAGELAANEGSSTVPPDHKVYAFRSYAFLASKRTFSRLMRRCVTSGSPCKHKPRPDWLQTVT